MAAKVIHFKKNGSSAPQKFVADDGGNNISAVLSSPRGAETIFLPFYRHRAARKQYFCLFIVTAQRGNNIFAFYRHRAARKQYFCLFIVTVRRGNDIFAVLSSPCSAGTIFLCFIVAVQRGNNIFAVLSSPCSAGTIFPLFYRRRAAREQYFCRFIVTVRRGNDISAVSVLAVLLKYIPERFWLLQANCERSEMWREPRGDGGGPRAEGKMKSSHSK